MVYSFRMYWRRYITFYEHFKPKYWKLLLCFPLLSEYSMTWRSKEEKLKIQQVFNQDVFNRIRMVMWEILRINVLIKAHSYSQVFINCLAKLKYNEIKQLIVNVLSFLVQRPTSFISAFTISQVIQKQKLTIVAKGQWGNVHLHCDVK